MAESPKGPDCQSMKMDWLIYIFANFSSESLAATRKSGWTLQTWNCHLDVDDISPFLYAILSVPVSLLHPNETRRLETETPLELEEIKVLNVNYSSSYTANGLYTIATLNEVILVPSQSLTWKASASTDRKNSLQSPWGKRQQQHLLWQTS